MVPREKASCAIGARVVGSGGAVAGGAKEVHFRRVRKRPWERYAAEIRDPRKKSLVWLGTFDTVEEATRAYDAAAREFHGSKAKTNISYPEAYQSPSTGGISGLVGSPSSQSNTVESSNGEATVSPMARPRLPSLYLDLLCREAWFPFQAFATASSVAGVALLRWFLQRWGPFQLVERLSLSVGNALVDHIW